MPLVRRLAEPLNCLWPVDFRALTVQEHPSYDVLSNRVRALSGFQEPVDSYTPVSGDRQPTVIVFPFRAAR